MKRLLIVLGILFSGLYVIANVKPYHFFRMDRKVDILQLNATLDDLYSRKQERRFRIETSTPTAQDMFAGEVILLEQTGNERIFIKLDSGSVFYTAVLTEL